MLRRAQHERKILNLINSISVRPELCRRVNVVFQQNQYSCLTLVSHRLSFPYWIASKIISESIRNEPVDKSNPALGGCNSAFNSFLKRDSNEDLKLSIIGPEAERSASAVTARDELDDPIKETNLARLFSSAAQSLSASLISASRSAVLFSFRCNIVSVCYMNVSGFSAIRSRCGQCAMAFLSTQPWQRASSASKARGTSQQVNGFKVLRVNSFERK